MTHTRAARATAVGGQVALGVAAHVSASGCPPSAAGLVLALPLSVVAVLLTSRAFPSRPLVRLAAGQLAVHATLTVVAACDGAHGSDVLMTYAHVVAVVLLHAGWRRTRRMLREAVRLAARLVPHARPVPAVRSTPCRLIVATAPGPSPLLRLRLPVSTGRRGPPCGRISRSPA